MLSRQKGSPVHTLLENGPKYSQKDLTEICGVRVYQAFRRFLQLQVNKSNWTECINDTYLKYSVFSKKVNVRMFLFDY